MKKQHTEPENMAFASVFVNEIDLPQMGNENSSRGNRYVNYGTSNRFPQEILDLYHTCSLFNSIIDSLHNYVANFDSTGMDYKTTEMISRLCFDYIMFGGFAIQINRFAGKDAVHYVDFANCRRSKDRKTIYYSRSFSKYNREETVEYPAYDPEGNEPSSILYVAPSVRSAETYPYPMCYPAIKSIYILTQIEDFWRGSLDNNLMPSAIITFKNGVPDDDTCKEIEKRINEKFGGASNAAKAIVLFADDAETAPTIERVPEDSFDSKYQSLVATVQQSLYQAFGMNPILLGKNDSNGGFSRQEFVEAFSLFYVSRVMKMQKTIESVLKSLNINVTFQRFKLDDEGEVETEATSNV